MERCVVRKTPKIVCITEDGQQLVEDKVETLCECKGDFVDPFNDGEPEPIDPIKQPTPFPLPGLTAPLPIPLIP